MNSFLLFLKDMHLRKLKLPGGLKLWVTFLSFIFLFKSFVDNFDKFDFSVLDSRDYINLFIGLVLTSFSLLANAIAWRSLINWIGYKEKNIHIVLLFIRTNILKYMPGGIWHFVERYRVLRKYMPRNKAIYSVLIEPFLMLIAALFLVPFGYRTYNSLFFFLPLLLFSRSFSSILKYLLNSSKIFKANILKEDLELIDLKQESLNLGFPLIPFIQELIFIFLRYMGFWFCLRSFSINSELDFFMWMSCFAISWSVGLLVPSAPGGLGVFEASLILLVPRSVPQTGLIAASICYRMITTFSDLLVALIVSKNSK